MTPAHSTPANLFQTLASLTDQVTADPQWQSEQDELGLTIVGMLLYGYGLAVGREVMRLDVAAIDGAVNRCLVERLGAEEPWSEELIGVASYSAFDPTYQPGYRELIQVGQQYLGQDDLNLVVKNIFANIRSMRRQTAVH